MCVCVCEREREREREREKERMKARTYKIKDINCMFCTDNETINYVDNESVLAEVKRSVQMYCEGAYNNKEINVSN